MKWNSDEDAIIFKHHNKEPLSEWSHLLPNRSLSAITTRVYRLGLSTGNTIKPKSVVPKFAPGIHVPDVNDFEKLWEAAYVFQSASSVLSTRVNEVDVTLDVSHPIAVCFVADTHIGSLDVPLDVVRSRFDVLEKYPYIFPAGCGDMVDNYIPTSHAAGMFGQIFPPELQKELVENLYSKLMGRWLWLIQGCHDEFSHTADDFDLTKYMSKHLGCANLGFGGLVNLTVGEQTYKIAARHKYRFNSSSNPLHTCMQLVRFDEKTADVAVVAHNHITAILHNNENDKDRVYIRPGSMKGADRWTRSVGYTETGRSMPCVVFWPDKRQMMTFMDLEQCVDFMESIGLGQA